MENKVRIAKVKLEKLHVSYQKYTLVYTITAIILASGILLSFMSSDTIQTNIKDQINTQAYTISQSIFENAKDSLKNSTASIAQGMKYSVLSKTTKSGEFTPKQTKVLESAFDETQEDLLIQLENTSEKELMKNQITKLTNPVLDKFLVNGPFGKILVFLLAFSILMFFKIPLFFILKSIVGLINILKKQRSSN